MTQNVLAIIGGSGLYNLPEIKDVEKINITTPFGAPSGKIIQGFVGDTKLLFIARHGEGHVHLPSEVPFRANVYALKKLGATHLLSVCAVGSLQEEIIPGDLVVTTQFIDKTHGRNATFFGEGIVGHVMFADPTCDILNTQLLACAKELNYKTHPKATMVVMEGPAFSTRAESHLHRQFGADLIGMTAMPEAKLAREAELCYGTLALATDYDCWREEEDHVTVDAIIQTIQSNVEKARHMIVELAKQLSAHSRTCSCAKALDNAIMTNPKKMPTTTKNKLMPIMGRVL